METFSNTPPKPLLLARTIPLSSSANASIPPDASGSQRCRPVISAGLWPMPWPRWQRARIFSDINAGVPSAIPQQVEPELMIRAVETVQAITDIPLCIDSSVVLALIAGLKAAKRQADCQQCDW